MVLSDAYLVILFFVWCFAIIVLQLWFGNLPGLDLYCLRPFRKGGGVGRKGSISNFVIILNFLIILGDYSWRGVVVLSSECFVVIDGTNNWSDRLCLKGFFIKQKCIHEQTYDVDCCGHDKENCNRIYRWSKVNLFSCLFAIFYVQWRGLWISWSGRRRGGWADKRGFRLRNEALHKEKNGQDNSTGMYCTLAFRISFFPM